MKNTLLNLIVAVSVLASSSSFALARMGIQAGLSSGNFNYEPAPTTSYGSRNGLSLGALVEFGLGTSLHLEVEGLYIQKGYTSPSVFGDSTIKFDFFEVPVVLKYIIDIPIVKPFLFAGGFFAFRTKAEAEAAGGLGTTDISAGYKTNDIGLTFGGGAEIAFTPMTSIFASARYDLGLTNLYQNPVGTQTAKSKAVVIMGGLIFGI